MQNFIAGDFEKDNDKLAAELYKKLKSEGCHSIVLFWARQNPDGSAADWIMSTFCRDMRLHPLVVIRHIINLFVKEAGN